jgi:heat shock protein HtpX
MGYRPPVAEGFARFQKGDQVSVLVQRWSLVELGEGTASPYDSHPSLPQRLAALMALPHEPAPLDDPTASGLLRDPDGLEVELLRHVSRLDVDALQPISWEDTTGKVWLEVWQGMCRQHRGVLEGHTPASLPQVVHHVASSSSSTEEPQTQKADTLCTVLGAALALVLARRGWTIDATPGNHVTATHDGIVIQPFDAVRRMSARELRGRSGSGPATRPASRTSI